jgi:hypothetical protein
MQHKDFINQRSETPRRSGPDVCQERRFGLSARILKGSCTVDSIIDGEYGTCQGRMQVEAQLVQKGAKN